jgi:hypothetical protein
MPSRKEHISRRITRTIRILYLADPSMGKLYRISAGNVNDKSNKNWDSQGTSYPPEKDTVYDRQTIPGDPEDLGRGYPLPEI